MSTIGWIQDIKSWAELLEWARGQDFADYKKNPGSIPFRVKNVLQHDGLMETWDGSKVEFAKQLLTAHYEAKPKDEMSREEQIKRGQTVMPI